MAAPRLASVVVAPSNWIRRRSEERSESPESVESLEEEKEKEKQQKEKERKKMDLLTTKSGGAYIPPAKLRLMQQQIEDKNRYVEISVIFN